VSESWKAFRNRPWLGSPLQRFGAWILERLVPPDIEPAECSYLPRPTPWFAADAPEGP